MSWMALRSLSPWRHSSISDHRQNIILFCNEGYQSVPAAANLQILGLIFATDMEGGFTGSEDPQACQQSPTTSMK